MPLINLGRIQQAHNRLCADTERMVDDVLQRAGEFAVKHSADNAGFGGTVTKNATEYKLLRVRGRLLRIQNKRKHAPFLEFGTRPHVIQGKPFLRFRVGGRLVVARRVNHPGTRPYKFLWRATHAAGRIIEPQIEQGMSRLARRF